MSLFRKPSARLAIAIVAILASVSCADPAQDSQRGAVVAQTSPGPQAKQRGLLVGCTVYDNNPRTLHLAGPGNDVPLMRNLLVERFGFEQPHIVELVEGAGNERRPTRANILREFDRLVAQSGTGDQVVIFMAGHGSQQPDDDRDEADGWDELFLPADVENFEHWNRDSPRLKGAIVDDELRTRLQSLLRRQAKVLVILDSCHSGSGIRGDLGDERSRKIEVPEDVRALVADKPPPSREMFDDLGAGDWVALYAAREFEPTFELPFPREDGRAQDRKTCGMFTYALCEALNQPAVPSYRELVQRIRGRYAAWGRQAPTPVVEGRDLDRSVLTGADRPLSFILERDASPDSWTIRAGTLHGLTPGSVLAVHAPDDPSFKQPRAHLRVSQASVLRSTLVPVDEDSGKARTAPPRAGDVCVPVFRNLGSLQLRIAPDPDLARTDTRSLLAVLEPIAGKADAPVQLVAAEDAQWFVGRASSTQPWQLVPRSQALLAKRGGDEPVRGGIRLSATEGDEFESALRRIVRTHNLLRLATELSARTRDESGMSVELEGFRRTAAGKTDRDMLPQDRPLDVHPGETLEFRVTNSGRSPAFVTLLFVDSQYNLEVIYPRQDFVDNQVTRERPFDSRPLTVTGDTTGTERVLLIAVSSDAGPVNYAFLAQPDFASAERTFATTRAGRPQTNLDDLLMSAAFQSGPSRGTVRVRRTEACVMRTLDWRVLAPDNK